MIGLFLCVLHLESRIGLCSYVSYTEFQGLCVSYTECQGLACVLMCLTLSFKGWHV